MNSSGIASRVLMVRPRGFRFNTRTARTNTFPRQSNRNPKEVEADAHKEFENVVAQLEHAGVFVIIFDPPAGIDTPDGVFPNNWISFHEDGTVVIYPMHDKSRRVEVNNMVWEELKAQNVYKYQIIHDFSDRVQEEQYLEGTGSLVLDRNRRVAYASLSERTSKNLVLEWCSSMGYEALVFTAVDSGGIPLYHTNVMLSIGLGFAVVCLESIGDAGERNVVRSRLVADGHRIIDISLSQMESYAGNVIELCSCSGERLLFMSQRAYETLRPDQLGVIELTNRIVSVPINTIEDEGGGSLRCMLAEVVSIIE